MGIGGALEAEGSATGAELLALQKRNAARRKSSKAAIGVGGTTIGKKMGHQSASPKGMEKKFAMGLLPMSASMSSGCFCLILLMGGVLVAMKQMDETA